MQPQTVPLQEVAQLIQNLRDLYVETLTSTINDLSDVTVLAECIPTNEDGTPLIMDGTNLPTRFDAVTQPDDGPEEICHIASTKIMEFPALETLVAEELELSLEPFTWDCMLLMVPLDTAQYDSVVSEWYSAHFVHSAEPGGLSGSVHFASKAEEIETGAVVELDMGSAPVDALWDLLARLANAGCRVAHLTAPQQDYDA